MGTGLDIYRLVEEYVEGIINHEDFETLRNYAKASSAQRDEVRRIMDISLSTNVINDATSYNENAAYSRFKQYVGVVNPKRTRLWWLVAAVAILLIATLPTLLMRHRQSAQMEQVIVLSVPDGSMLDFTLPDGTQITLTSASKLSYTRGYGVTDRMISMIGEGYIRVKHNANLPFIINTKHMQITDLGTKFTVRDYPEESSMNVRLDEGELSLHNYVRSEDDVFMKAGDVAFIDKATGKVIVDKSQICTGGRASLNKIIFNDMPLSQIALQLQRYYGVRITVTANAAERRYYGTFDRSVNSITDVLNSLATTKSLKYKRTKKGLLIY